jgi:hypothetical protein
MRFHRSAGTSAFAPMQRISLPRSSFPSQRRQSLDGSLYQFLLPASYRELLFLSLWVCIMTYSFDFAASRAFLYPISNSDRREERLYASTVAVSTA